MSSAFIGRVAAVQEVPFIVAITILNLTKMAASSPSPNGWTEHGKRYVSEEIFVATVLSIKSCGCVSWALRRSCGRIFYAAVAHVGQ